MQNNPTIPYSDFEKLDIQVAEIKEAEEIKGADQLYKLTISLGDETRTICSGIKEYYTKEELKGKKIIVLANLKPKILRGVESQGMLLAAENKETNQCILLTPDKEIKNGTKIT